MFLPAISNIGNIIATSVDERINSPFFFKSFLFILSYKGIQFKKFEGFKIVKIQIYIFCSIFILL